METFMVAVALMMVKMGAVFWRIWHWAAWDRFGINNTEFTEVVERYVVAVKS